MKRKEKKNQISALFSTQTPPDNWPDVVVHLTIGLIANEYTKLGKTNENLILSLELSYIKNPTVLFFPHCDLNAIKKSLYVVFMITKVNPFITKKNISTQKRGSVQQ